MSWVSVSSWTGFWDDPRKDSRLTGLSRQCMVVDIEFTSAEGLLPAAVFFGCSPGVALRRCDLCAQSQASFTFWED